MSKLALREEISRIRREKEWRNMRIFWMSNDFEFESGLSDSLLTLVRSFAPCRVSMLYYSK